MKKSKTALVILMAMLLSACSEGNATGETTLPETSGTESSVTETVSVSEETSAETATTPDIIGNEASEALSQTAVTKKRTGKWAAQEYFAENGYKFSSGTLYIDMNDHRDGTDPLKYIDKDHLNFMNEIALENAGSSDISFLDNYGFKYVTLEKYSGNYDLSRLSLSVITLDDYRGGDLSSLSECGNVSLRFKNNSGREDLSFISGLHNINSLRFDHYDENTDLGFLSECPDITSLSLTNKSINAENIAKVLENSNIEQIYICTEDYSSEDAELIMMAAPDCAVSYNIDMSPWYERPCEGVAFFTNLYVYPDRPEKWECLTDDAGTFNRDIWYHTGSLVCTFSNFTDNVQQINSVEIFKNVDGSFVPLKFPDGSYVCDIDFTIDPGKNSDLEISNEMFPFNECDEGIYKVVFNSEFERPEQQFYITRSLSEDFLTGEQTEAYKKAYEITREYFGSSTYMTKEYADGHTVDEFLSEICTAYTYDYAYETARRFRYIDENGQLRETASDRGGDITFQRDFLIPIYSDENEVLFKCFIIHGHEDNPYFLWYEEINNHMVKTEDGWRFDNYQLVD